MAGRRSPVLGHGNVAGGGSGGGGSGGRTKASPSVTRYQTAKAKAKDKLRKMRVEGTSYTRAGGRTTTPHKADKARKDAPAWKKRGAQLGKGKTYKVKKKKAAGSPTTKSYAKAKKGK